MSSDFIKEKIKDRPVDKKKLAKRIGLTVLIAIIFGAVSAITFTIVYSKIMPEDKETVKEVTLYETEPEETGPYPDASVSESDMDDTVSVDSTVSEDSSISESSVSEDSASVSENEQPDKNPHASSTIINNITNHVDMSPESYSRLYRSLHEVAEEARHALVTVTAITTDTDWFENPYENGNSSTGTIIADNGREILILVDGAVTDKAEEISVRFVDGTSAPATVLNTDTDTLLQIVGVNISDISDETMESISYARLGSSTYASTVGTPVIAIGAPIGIIGSEDYGFITSMSQEKEMSDLNVHLLTTDIPGSDNASGVIIDYSGHILGVITNAYSESNLDNMITTFSISDIKETIENLANGKKRTYMGIIGTSVTQDAVDAYGMPVGAYVINVDPDSPAMKAGIQSGDVITKIGTQNIIDYDDYSKSISELSEGVETVVTVQRFSRGKYTELTFETELSSR
ncbi:MAG: S1C family serine protease [Lachnospiraceae bacterium]|nr:S1C family serine protease [Lachnospiraceae bacterium]